MTRMLRMILAGFVGLLAVTCASVAVAEPPIWVVKSGKTQVFLFGQMGIRADTQWQSTKIWKAFNKSTELWTENPQEHTNVDPSLINQLSRNARPISELLNETDLARLQAALKMAGLPSSSVNSLNAYVLLEGALEQQAGLDVGNLPERVFAKKAAETGKPIHSEFGTVDAQLRFSSALPQAVQIGLIKRALDDWDAGVTAMNGRIAAWRAGDLAIETSYIERNCDLSPEMCRTIGTDRNALWVSRIKEMLSKPGAYFVCIGIGHLVGPDSVISQLEAAGIRVKRR